MDALYADEERSPERIGRRKHLCKPAQRATCDLSFRTFGTKNGIQYAVHQLRELALKVIAEMVKS